MKKQLLSTIVFTAAMLTSCMQVITPPDPVQPGSTEDEKDNWQEQIGTAIDPLQKWITAFSGTVKVTVPADGSVSVYCEDATNRTYLAKYQVKAGEKTIKFDVPQHLTAPITRYDYDQEGNVVPVGTMSREIIVEFKYQGNTTTGRISFDEAKNGAAVSFNGQATTRAVTRAEENNTAVNESPNKAGLTGKTLSGGKLHSYATFPGYILDDLAAALPETKAAVDQINTYEMTSNGHFLIALLYGCTGNSTREIGYYYYDKGHPESKTYVPFCDILKYDYFYDVINYTKSNPISKTQVKVSGSWYDVNYDHYDRLGWSEYSIPNAYHKRDDVYNILDVYDRQKSQIQEIRGMTLEVNVEKGKVLGFYCKLSNASYNHSDKELNSWNSTYSSIIRIYNGFRFIGLEDSFHSSVNATEPDCNDIAFVMVPGGDLPDIRLPYIIDKTDGVHKDMYYNGDGTWTEEPKKDPATDGPGAIEEGEEESTEGLQSWTIGFEDTGTSGDYDFNDVVIRVTPITSTQKAKVELCAVGGVNYSDLYYKDQKLGEVHYLMGIESGTMANTNHGGKEVQSRVVAEVDWPEGKTMTENASDFYIISSGKKQAVPTVTGVVPTAICVSGEWKWPSEQTRISEAYPDFGHWGENYGKVEYSNWYTKPRLEHVY